MEKLKSLFSTVSGIFAIIPGLSILISNVGVPPNTSKFLFAGTIESLGVLTLLLLWLNKEKIASWSVYTVTKLCVIAIIIFFISFVVYIFLFGWLVVPVDNADSLFFPLWANGELQKGLADYGGSKSELIRQWGRDDVYKVIQNSSTAPLLWTTILFLFIYQLIFVALTFAFGVLGTKHSSIEPHPRSLS
jgi:hypothetical protein